MSEDPNLAEIRRLDRELAETKAQLAAVTATRDDLYTSVEKAREAIARARDERERMLPVYESAKEWRRWHGNKSFRHPDPEDALEASIDTALAAEKLAVSS